MIIHPTKVVPADEIFMMTAQCVALYLLVYKLAPQRCHDIHTPGIKTGHGAYTEQRTCPTHSGTYSHARLSILKHEHNPVQQL